MSYSLVVHRRAPTRDWCAYCETCERHIALPTETELGSRFGALSHADKTGHPVAICALHGHSTPKGWVGTTLADSYGTQPEIEGLYGTQTGEA
jgi:hypothetical protein